MGKNIVETRISRLKKEIIPGIVKNGKFKNSGPDSKIEDIDVKNADAGSDHWASATVFVEVHLNNKKGRSTERIVVKYPPIDEQLQYIMTADRMYENEVVIYTEVIPKYREFIEKQSEKLNDPDVKTLLDGMFPVCYYAEYDTENPVNSVVILNDVRDFGYKLAPHRNNLDLNHVKLSLNRLGRYHGAGYAYKLSNKVEYENLLSKLKKCKYSEDLRERNKWSYSNVQAQRAIRRIMKDKTEGIKEEDLKRLDEIFEDFYGVMIYLTRTTESSILCHGDFCANNLLFKYHSSGDPECAIVIDFQTPYYSSPAIDLSFFLLVGTDQHFRNQHFNEMFQYYHSIVVDTMTKILGRPITEPGFTLQDFRKEYADHAAYGYGISSFFLPVMLNIILHNEPFDLADEVRKNQTEDPEKRKKIILSRGGEAATQMLVSLFTELYDKNCFQDILNNYSADTHL